jgi:hypothetical protein
VVTVVEFDRETQRLRFAATLRGDPPAEIAEMVGAREDWRAEALEKLRERNRDG